jgi:hypothetical protein
MTDEHAPSSPPNTPSAVRDPGGTHELVIGMVDLPESIDVTPDPLVTAIAIPVEWFRDEVQEESKDQHQDIPALKGWSAWVSQGAPAGGFVGRPATISRNSGVYNIYVRGADNALWQRGWDGQWHDWGRHGDGAVLASEPALGSMGPDHEQVFIRGTDNQVYSKWWTARSGWSSWVSLGAPPGGFVGAPTTISRNSSVCNLYVRGADNLLWQRAFYNGEWHPWWCHDDGHQIISEPVPGSMGPNHEHIFARGTDNNIWQKRFEGL